MVSRWRPKMWGLPGGVKKGVVEKSDASESKGLKCGGKVAKLQDTPGAT